MIPVGEEDEPITIKGHFSVLNEGTEPLHNPIICLSFSEPSLANLSGKINAEKRKRQDELVIGQDREQESWRYVADTSAKTAKETGQFWLQPLHLSTVEANQKLIFSDFEIMLPQQANEASSLIIQGFVYGEELSEGKKAENTIICNLL